MSPKQNSTRTQVTHLPEIAFELSDEELRIVSAAAMSCEEARARAIVFYTFADIFYIFGSKEIAAACIGSAEGMKAAAC